MKEVDYIVVGLGIAGICFCEQLREHGKSFVVFDAAEQTATAIAGGVVNPVALKRFTPAWNVAQFLPRSLPFFKKISERLETPFLQIMGIDRILHSVQEQNDWLVASDSLRLSFFLSSEIVKNTNTSVEAPFGFGSVAEVFKIDTPVLIRAYREDLLRSGNLISENFDYDAINSEEQNIQYKKHSARKIIFAEGAGAINNPYFSVDCLIPKKGEYIVVKVPQLGLKSILKGPIFVIPLGDDLYKVGASFDHHATTCEITEEGKAQLVAKLKKIINCSFEVVDQMAGMRPTVKDRRPLLGTISQKNMIFFNGLGTRGLGMAPLLSSQLYDFAEHQTPLPDEINIQRFN